jgi:hypothetical protein
MSDMDQKKNSDNGACPWKTRFCHSSQRSSFQSAFMPSPVPPSIIATLKDVFDGSSVGLTFFLATHI